MQSAIPSKESGIGSDLPLDIAQQLMRTVAHDLRTPITVLRGYLKMLLSGRAGAITSDQKGFLEPALNSVDQLTKFAVVVAGVAELLEQFHPESLNLAEDIWRTVWRTLEPGALAKSIVLSEKFPMGSLVLTGDRALLCNAVEALAILSIAAADSGTTLEVEGSIPKQGTLELRITFSSLSLEMKADEMASRLLSTVFLHGGQLALRAKSGNKQSVKLLLPGKDS